MTMHSQNDPRRVALIKSLLTKNRFYALIHPDRNIRNADTVEDIPGDLLLGIAYPCLEDGLNDFAVIRTTFETLDLFPEDDPIREEMMEIVNDARSNLLRRLNELRDKIHTNHAHFLGTDYNEFKSYALGMVNRGYRRRDLDSMMKLNVFSSVAEAEGYTDSNEIPYYYQFVPTTDTNAVAALPTREFIVALFSDVLTSVLDDANYTSKYLFDRNVFQKFIAVMFVNYATTDQMFYGINKADYAVSGAKDMDSTPLYIAIRKELTEIEKQLWTEGKGHALPDHPGIGYDAPDFGTGVAPDFITGTTTPDFGAGVTPDFGGPNFAEPYHAERLTPEELAARLPRELVNEEVLLGPISSLCQAAQLLKQKGDADTQRYARVILADACRLVDELKRLNIISPLSNNPGTCD
jgi:hypothetical protein